MIGPLPPSLVSWLTSSTLVLRPAAPARRSANWAIVGNRLYFSSDRGGTGQTGLFVSSFDSSAFANPMPVAFPVSLHSVTLSGDELEMFYSTGLSGIGRATRNSSSDAFIDKGDVTEIHVTGELDSDPALSSDGLTLYWQHGVDSNAPFHIVMAQRPSPTEPFGARQQIPELDSPDNDGSPEITPDGKRMLLSSNRTGSVGSDDLYQSTFSCPDQPGTSSSAR